MREEEKKQEEVASATGGSKTEMNNTAANEGGKADGASESGSPSGKTEETPAWKTAAEGMRKRAAERRQYAQSPVDEDTSGQRDYMHEFINSRIAKSQETDEQRMAREKRERTARRLTALSDGLVALSNVTGAMFGATPVKQTSLSAAHKKAVQEAAERRRQNARQYEVARQNAQTLAYKQDAANAKRRADELERRRKAGDKADDLETKAAQLELQGSKADRSAKLAEDKAEAARQHQKETERQGRQRIALSQERNDISRSKGGGRSGGGSAQADFDEYARWEKEHPKEVEDIRENNAQINPYTKQPEKGVSTTTVKLVNAKMRQKYGSPGQKTTTRQKKSVAGFGGGSKSAATTKKKTIAGFGTK